MEIKLTDVGLTTEYTFYNTLLKYNIKTVEDLLDESKINSILSRTRSLQVRQELQGYIELVKNRIQGTPLTTDIFLEQMVVPLTEEQKNLRNQASFFELGYSINFSRMGFTNKEIQRIYFFFITECHSQELRLIDLMKKFIESNPTTELSIKMKQFLNSYDKNIEDNLLYEKLQSEIKILKTKREELDEKIESLEQKLQTLQEVRRKK